MKDLINKAQSLMELLRCDGPEKDVPKFWLARTAGRLNRKFAASAAYSVSDVDKYLRIEIKEQVFLWPKNSPHSGALQILSEILLSEHPHQYLYGQTTVSRDDVVLDIGACEGAFAAVVTSQCKRVIAVEPSRSMCALMRALFAARNQECPVIVNCLLGGEPGSAYFLEDASNPGASRIVSAGTPGAYQVPVMTLDQIVDTLDWKPTFIKCDAEGAEPEIFRGGQQFLRQFHPKLAITTYHNDGDYAAMHSLLTSIGYRTAGKGFLYSPANAKLRVQMIHAW